ncbi:MAG: hypothetical protein KME19_08880 [Microcoleus vaginatus WJT46-NPBG5]|nr:hypothetical protein [Microcoleus vaginatus WJT46-NPBG5]MBW4680214.1 hypothetical protein [Microcoleus vaginatus WJT46-NPBG5]
MNLNYLAGASSIKRSYVLEMWVLNNGYLYALRLFVVTPWRYLDPWKPAFGYKRTIAIEQFIRLYGEDWRSPINKAMEAQERFITGDWRSVNEYHQLIAQIADHVEIIRPLKINQES